MHYGPAIHALDKPLPVLIALLVGYLLHSAIAPGLIGLGRSAVRRIGAKLEDEDD